MDLARGQEGRGRRAHRVRVHQEALGHGHPLRGEAEEETVAAGAEEHQLPVARRAALEEGAADRLDGHRARVGAAVDDGRPLPRRRVHRAQVLVLVVPELDRRELAARRVRRRAHHLWHLRVHLHPAGRRRGEPGNRGARSGWPAVPSGVVERVHRVARLGTAGGRRRCGRGAAAARAPRGSGQRFPVGRRSSFFGQVEGEKGAERWGGSGGAGRRARRAARGGDFVRGASLGSHGGGVKFAEPRMPNRERGGQGAASAPSMHPQYTRYLSLPATGPCRCLLQHGLRFSNLDRRSANHRAGDPSLSRHAKATRPSRSRHSAKGCPPPHGGGVASADCHPAAGSAGNRSRRTWKDAGTLRRTTPPHEPDCLLVPALRA